MKHRLGWTYGQGPSRWSFPTQPKHACRPHKQLYFALLDTKPIAVEDLRIPMSAFVTRQPRFPVAGRTISHSVDTLIRQDLLDVRRHIRGDWG